MTEEKIGGGRMKMIMTEIVATNVITSQLPERRPLVPKVNSKYCQLCCIETILSVAILVPGLACQHGSLAITVETLFMLADFLRMR